MPKLLPVYKYAAAFAAGLAVGWIYNGSLWSAKHERLISAHAQAVAEGQAKVRAVEQGWAAAMIEVQKDARNKQDNAASELGDTNDELARLREANNKRTDRATRDTSDACRSAPASSALLLYSQLFDSCSARVVELAGEADRRRVAGLACEASYDAIRQQGR